MVAMHHKVCADEPHIISHIPQCILYKSLIIYHIGHRYLMGVLVNIYCVPRQILWLHTLAVLCLFSTHMHNNSCICLCAWQIWCKNISDLLGNIND